MSRLHLSLLAGVALALAASDDAAAPKGEPGDLTVRAYVDRDVSGTFTTGDLAVQGMIVTATPTDAAEGATPFQATTDGTGTATFGDLPPGAYAITFDPSTAPAGVVLTTNPTPTVAISYQGNASATPEFRYVFQPAVLSGRVYRNNDTDTTYLAGTDTPGPGLKVWLRADTGSAVPGPKVDSTTTDAEGAYSFARVAPGNYWVEFENPGTIDYGNLAAQRVTLQPAITSTRQARFTGSLVLTVAEARAAAANSRVAVVGNIVTPPGSFTSSSGTVSEIWVQDATGGIAVFSVATTRAAELALGQKVQVVGNRGANAGQLQITSPTVTTQTGSTIIAPRTISGAEFNARTYEGQLGRVLGILVDSIGTTTSTSFTVFGKTPDAQPVQIRVIGAVINATTGDTTVKNTGLTRADFVPGQAYDVTGELTVFVQGTVDNVQIKPRFKTDVTSAVAPLPKIVINEFMANPATTTDPAGEYVELYNAGTFPVNLTGYILLDLSATGTVNAADTIGVSTPTPTPLIIQPGGYVLLAHVNTVTTATLVPDYRYKAVGGGIQLNNTGTQPIVLRNPANVTVDSVAYTIATVPGVARGVVDPNADNSNGSVNWVDQTSIYSTVGTLSEKGTPKARNDGAAAGVAAAVTVPSYPAASRAVAPAKKPKATAAPRR